MKTRIFLFACAAVLTGCSGHKPDSSRASLQPEQADTNAAQSGVLIHGDSVKGDFNGDGKEEYGWAEHDDAGVASCAIAFSDKMLLSIDLGKDLYGARLINEGDLDDNGTDELSVVPYGDAGEWSNCSLYSFVDGKWLEALKPFAVYGNGGDYIQKDPKQKNAVIITEFSYSEKSGISSSQRTATLFGSN